MRSHEQSIVEAVQRYYNNPQTVYKFSLWAPDPRRPGVSAAHLGLDDVEYFHSNILRRMLDVLRHRRAVDRMTRLIIRESQVEDGHAVLDAGCGTGSIAFPLAEQNKHAQIFAVSLSHSQLEVARKYQQSAGIKNVYFSEQNFTRMAFREASFDRVIFAESFCHAPNKLETIREVSRVLKPGGKVLIVDPLYLKPPAGEQLILSEALGSTQGLAMANLLSVEELVEALGRAGMQTEHILDLTKRVTASLALIANGYINALTHGRAEPSALIDSYLAWYMLTAQGTLGYLSVRGRKLSSAS
jgi:ubiquinone/menaquinone biosynthesis C-methylase UbiE